MSKLNEFDSSSMLNWGKTNPSLGYDIPIENTSPLLGGSLGLGGGDGGMGYGFSAPSFDAPAGATDWMSGFGKALGDFIGTSEKPGYGGPLMGGLGALAKGFLGMKQYGIAKKTLEENKRQFAMNYDAQKRTTNAAMEDRQRARLAANDTGIYQSVGDYMNKNGIV